MDTKLICLLAIMLLILSCDPNTREITFLIGNRTTQALTVSLFKESKENAIDIFESDTIQFLTYSALGGGFNAIADFDSIGITIEGDNRSIKWTKPGNGYGYIDENIGQERDVPKDIYNRKNWQLGTNGDDEKWIFTINESDLNLFE